MTCEICAYGDEHGWFGPTMSGKTHCRTCHATWGGTTKAHCTACHETFATSGVADHHWIKPDRKARAGTHTHPSEIPAFWTDQSGVWHYGPKRDPQTILELSSRVLRGDLEES